MNLTGTLKKVTKTNESISFVITFAYNKNKDAGKLLELINLQDETVNIELQNAQTELFIEDKQTTF